MSVFNEAFLVAAKDAGADAPPEAAAHRAAWTAVLKEYEPADVGKWPRRKR